MTSNISISLPLQISASPYSDQLFSPPPPLSRLPWPPSMALQADRYESSLLDGITFYSTKIEVNGIACYKDINWDGLATLFPVDLTPGRLRIIVEQLANEKGFKIEKAIESKTTAVSLQSLSSIKTSSSLPPTPRTPTSPKSMKIQGLSSENLHLSSIPSASLIPSNLNPCVSSSSLPICSLPPIRNLESFRSSTDSSSKSKKRKLSKETQIKSENFHGKKPSFFLDIDLVKKIISDRENKLDWDDIEDDVKFTGRKGTLSQRVSNWIGRYNQTNEKNGNPLPKLILPSTRRRKQIDLDEGMVLEMHQMLRDGKSWADIQKKYNYTGKSLERVVAQWKARQAKKTRLYS